MDDTPKARRRGALGWISWPALGTIAGALAASLLTLAADQLTVSTPRAEAAGRFGDGLESRLETFGDRGDQFKTAALAAADPMLLGEAPWQARTGFRRFDQTWANYQRIYKDNFLATAAAQRAGVLSEGRTVVIQQYSRNATNASLRVYRCVHDAINSYGPGSPGVIRQRNVIELKLRCQAGSDYFELDSELDKIDQCNSAIRTAMADLAAAMRVERADSPLTVVKRRLRLGGENGAGSLNERWLEISRDLATNCRDLASERRRLEGALYPWQVTDRFETESGPAADDGLIEGLAPPRVAIPAG